ncbi:MAG: hypothetical protein J1E06_05835 [Acutalibacter sp.]|nr:hypothetical protein [Acutalibacter sp.]
MKRIKSLFNRKAEKPCKYCTEHGDFLSGPIRIRETTPWPTNIFLYSCSKYLQIFNNNVPSIDEKIEINFCPMCGRKLRKRKMPPTL